MAGAAAERALRVVRRVESIQQVPLSRQRSSGIDFGAHIPEAAALLLHRQKRLGERLLGDYIDCASRLGAPVQQRGRSLHYIDALHICEISEGVMMQIR